MLEPIKFLFILTGASTYLVTKYIKVGIDNTNHNGTLFANDSWNGGGGGNGSGSLATTAADRTNSVAARLGPNHTATAQFFNYPSNSAGVSNATGRNRHIDPTNPLFRQHQQQQQQSNSYHIALIASSPNKYPEQRQNQTWRKTLDTNPLTTRSRPAFEIEINEEDDRNLPKRLLQISLSNDDNSQADEKVFYTISGDGVSDSLSRPKFSINSTTGEFYVLQPLDRDQPRGRKLWKLTASAQSLRNRTTLGEADIVVHLKDVNDNTPIFTHSIYRMNISENSTAGQFVGQIEAIDFDDPTEGTNAVITYRIEVNQMDDYGGTIFAIDPMLGTIRTLVCCLDREKRSNYSIVVSATDGGGRQSNASVVVTLFDVNDEPPRFTKKEWHVEIDETDTEMPTHYHHRLTTTSKLKAIVKLTATDNDQPETNQFHYQIIGERYSKHAEKLHKADFMIGDDNEVYANYTENFALTPVDGGVLLSVRKPLDYENPMQRFITVKILLSDRGEDFSDRYHIDVCIVCIKVRDTNDNKPRFAQHFINVSLAENIVPGTIITKFLATDADQNGYSPVLYSLDFETNRKRYFSIDSEGFVKLNRPLDRETIPTHIVKVIAGDTGEPPLTTTATLVVNVDDINDNAPLLVNTTLPVVMENTNPSRLGELYAFDLDDYSKGNGPPFTFYLDPEASETIKRNFRLETDFKGEGKAILYSRTAFDRESQREYSVPVVVRDSGYPSLSSTCAVTVTIGDVNDNDMKDGWKNVTVFYITDEGYQSDQQSKISKSVPKLVEIGRVNVEDPDDWDSEDKVYFWHNNTAHSLYYLNTDTGSVYAKSLKRATHQLRFSVFDRRYQHQSHSIMNVQIVDLPLNAVINSGSLRITGLDSFRFISIWDWKARKRKRASLKEELEANLKHIIDCDEVRIFSLIDHKHAGWMVNVNGVHVHHSPILDIRYYAKLNGRFLSAVYLNGIVQQNSHLLRNNLTFTISQIGINECMSEDQHPCESASCFTDVTIDWTNPSYLIHANYTSFVGINLHTKAKCACFYDNLLSHLDESQKSVCDIDQTLCSSYLDMSDSCHIKDKISSFTRNYLTSVANLNVKCVNSRSLAATNSRSFKGDGWIWLDPLPLCSENFLSIQVATSEPNGILLYHGPISDHKETNDFLLLLLIDGKLKLLFNFGTRETNELTVDSGHRVNDGNWHQVDVYFDTTRVRLMLDTCVHSTRPAFGSVEVEMDKCQNVTSVTAYNQLLNVNAPVQVGGITTATRLLLFNHLNVSHRLLSPFTGCIRSFVVNSHIYDLVDVHHSHHSHVGCYSTNSLCTFLNKKCHNNGFCDGNYNRAKCICSSGFYGADCGQPSQPVIFHHRSFIHLSIAGSGQSAAAAAVDSSEQSINFYHGGGSEFKTGFITKIEFNFRTRQSQGEIIRLMGTNLQTYCVVEIQNSRIIFRFNLKGFGSKSEKLLTVDSFRVDDGRWHHVEAYRFGQSAFLAIDNGGIGKSTRLVEEPTSGLQQQQELLFKLDDQRILLGGEVHYLGFDTTTIINDYVDGCLNDLRINDIFIPLSDLIQPGKHAEMSRFAITKMQNVEIGCKPAQNPCTRLQCHKPLVCVDQWMLAKCSCPNGYLISDDGKSCHKRTEVCKTNPCLCRGTAGGGGGGAAFGYNQSEFDDAKLSRLLSSGTIDDGGTSDCDERSGEEVDVKREETGDDAITVNARIFQLEYGVFVIVIIALVPLNIPFIIYIIYICCRKRRTADASVAAKADNRVSGSTPAAKSSGAFPDDIRENIVCYRDEGGGEHDVKMYDMIPLRIQVATGTIIPEAYGQQPLLLGPAQSDKPITDMWQELTVI